MSDNSTFESRTGRVSCSAEELFYFLTDIRNFRRFIPEDTFRDIILDKDSCSFTVSMMGKVNIHVKEKTEYTEVIFSGDAPQVNEFSLAVKFHNAGPGFSEVRLSVIAILNPMLKMFASDPINRFLETMINEMEKFRDWKEISGDN